MNRALRIALTVLVLATAMGSLSAGDVKLKPGAILLLEFPDLPDTLATMETGERQPARLIAQLPANYSLNGKSPLMVFLNRGDGGRGNDLPVGRETVGSNDFICVNLPLFKRAPLDTNFLISMPDFETMSRAYRVMLGKLLDTLPNVTTERSVFGGFSAGAHTTGVLLAGRDEFILKHFRSFYLLEGGFGPLAAHVLGSPTMKPNRFLIMRGDQPDKNPKYLPYFNALDHLAQALEYSAQEQHLDFTYIVMKGYGHELAPKYRALLGQWVRGEKLLESEKK
jgi:hypothetical protein